MSGKRATLADVARLSGMSITAASMILNGRPDTRLSQDAHDRVNAAAQALGYRPNVAARGLRTDKTLTIGFISDLVATTRFASGLIKGALEAAEAAGHVVLLLETGGDPQREAEAIAAVLDRQVDGIIFATMRARELFVPELPSATAVVMLNASNRLHAMSVLPDEEAGGRRAVQLLIERGHRDGIALIGQNDEVERDKFRSVTVARRVAGIRSEMAKNDLTFMSEESIWLWEPEGGYKATRALFRRNQAPSALLCLNDRIAFGAYQALAEEGLRVPTDVSVASFDNDELAAYLRPGLTTVALPHEAMGRRAVELLLSQEAQREVLIEMPVVERESISVPSSR
ncbi:LacI family DNA-binding transcriptional regulator [Microbacterium pumilum]|uniref:LacI family DNA-binding transcriptional regulator n=1 Tax=Microbacterium pumilum TaxID=344165 RepID=A0ABN2T3N2_9MICO